MYARKRISKSKLFGHDKQNEKVYENELKTLSKVVDNDHLIKVKGTYTDRKHLVMLLDPVADGNLKDFMTKSFKSLVTSKKEQDNFRTYFGCLAHTIRFLHDPSVEILHKDIKPENVLLKGGHLILTDFGTAFDWSKTGHSMTRSNARDPRTPRYQSPEVAIASEFHRSSDIWSLGVLFLEMVTVLRGKELREMDNFLQNHGNHHTEIHSNLESAMNWFEVLQAIPHGSVLDNEPLVWIKKMLNRVKDNRPPAEALFEEIVNFQDSMFCGRCCQDLDTDTDSDQASESDISDSYEPAQNNWNGYEPAETIRPYSCMRGAEPDPSWPNMDKAFLPEASMSNPIFIPDNRGVKPYPSLPEVGNPSFTEAPVPIPQVMPDSRDVDPHQALSEVDNPLLTEPTWPNPGIIPDPNVVFSPEISVTTFRPRRLSNEASLQKTQISSGSKAPASGLSSLPPIDKKPTVKSKLSGFPGRELFIKWLASSNDTLKRARNRRTPDSPQQSYSTVQSQRIGHFLSSLPEEIEDYEVLSTPHQGTDYKYPIGSFSPAQRSLTLPDMVAPHMERSRSQEDLTSSHTLEEESEETKFADFTISRLVHSASDSDLTSVRKLTHEDHIKTIQDLKTFASTFKASWPMKDFADEDQTRTLQELKTFASTFKVSWPVKDFAAKSTREVKEASSAKDVASWAESNPLKTHLDNVRGLAGPGLEHLARTAQEQRVSRDTARNKTPVQGSPTRLGAWLGKGTKERRKRYESASVIMEQILDNKTAEAPTTIMSASTRAKLSQGRPLTRWNDHYYSWLPAYVANGKVGAVRDLLDAGCNPGTVAKPRWAPIYNAVRGASDKHTKCLRALVSHGANVNARKDSNGRRPLHYAIEQAIWSGYSTVVYILLAARADPNARDRAGDIPLLMLLVGDGQLPQEKRDALYLLLAPNFFTDLEVIVPGTRDNPLHLAIRRKDAYVVDAILQKMEQAQGTALALMFQQNASGFTPLLLAFALINTTDDVAEGLQIIKLLLEHGAKPNDQDVTHGDTPLHFVVRDFRNAVALHLLCKHSANPRIPNKAGRHALNIVRTSRDDNPDDKWYVFAEQRMRNELKDDDYRPPDLVDYLNEEAEHAKYPENKSSSDVATVGGGVPLRRRY